MAGLWPTHPRHRRDGRRIPPSNRKSAPARRPAQRNVDALDPAPLASRWIWACPEPAAQSGVGARPGVVVGRADLLGQRLVAVKSCVLIDGHRCLRGVAGAGLEFRGGGALLAGEGEGCVAQVVDRQVRTASSLAGGTVAVYQVAHTHVIGAVAGEQQSVKTRGGVLK